MSRPLAALAFAALLVACAGIARAQGEVSVTDDKEPARLNTPDYYAGTEAAGDAAACPDGNCPPGGANGAHGAHLGPHGKHYVKAREMAGYYPNGIENYSDFVGARAYAGPGGCRTCANGQCQYRYYGQPDLFYNYYAWPSCTGWGAELYVSPLPVPPHVGHTYITYQPLMPHEFLYQHHRTYHRYYNGGQGLTRTSVIWWSPWLRK
jgi:hypothetical protein